MTGRKAIVAATLLSIPAIVWAVRSTTLPVRAMQGGESAGDEPPGVDSPLPELFNDEALLIEVAARGDALQKGGSLRSTEHFQKQLNRAFAAVDLPHPAAPQAGSVQAARRTIAHRPDLRAESADDRLAQLYAECTPSVLVVAILGKCEDCDRFHAVDEATAFVLTADGLCATNYHVFEDGKPDEYMVAATARGVVYPVVEVLAANQRDDAAVFRIDPRGDRLRPIPLRTDCPVGTPIAVISHPDQHHFALTAGRVARRVWYYGGMTGDMEEFLPPEDAPPGPSAKDGSFRPSHAKLLTPVLEVTADYGIGSSGGPVLDMAGNAVGMVSNTHTIYADPDKEIDPQMVVRTCVPAESIVRLVRTSARK